MTGIADPARAGAEFVHGAEQREGGPGRNDAPFSRGGTGQSSEAGDPPKRGPGDVSATESTSLPVPQKTLRV